MGCSLEVKLFSPFVDIGICFPTHIRVSYIPAAKTEAEKKIDQPRLLPTRFIYHFSKFKAQTASFPTKTTYTSPLLRGEAELLGGR